MSNKQSFDDMFTELENNEFKKFYIETKAAEINDALKSQFSYYETEEYLSDYFNDYDNNDVQINYSDYTSENEEIKEIVLQLINRYYEKDFIDICEFNIDYSYCNPKKAIFYSIGNLGEFENQLDDNSKKILDTDICKEEIEREIDYTISGDNCYAYNSAPIQILYHISMNSFFKSIVLNCIDETEDKKEINLLFNLYKLCNKSDIETDIAKTIIKMYYTEIKNKREFAEIIKENDFTMSEGKLQYRQLSDNKKYRAVIFVSSICKLADNFPCYFNVKNENDDIIKQWKIEDKQDFIDYIQIFNDID